MAKTGAAGELTPTSKAGHPDINGCARAAGVVAWIGRSLLILCTLTLLLLPISEQLWTWDRFLQGGRDFELETLTVLAFFSLVLVLSKQGKQRVESLFSPWCVLAIEIVDRVPPAICLHQEALALFPEPVNGPGIGMSGHPLQV